MRFEKDRKLDVLIEMEKLSQVNIDLLWNYVNKDKRIDDPDFIRADDFHKYPIMIKDLKRQLKKELSQE